MCYSVMVKYNSAAQGLHVKERKNEIPETRRTDVPFRSGVRADAGRETDRCAESIHGAEDPRRKVGCEGQHGTEDAADGRGHRRTDQPARNVARKLARARDVRSAACR